MPEINQQSTVKQLLLASCLAVGLSSPLQAAIAPHTPGQIFTPTEWRRMGSYTTGGDDLIILADGTRFMGELLKVPKVQFSFGSVSLKPEDVSLISFVEMDGQPKVQVISRDGQQYLGARSPESVLILERIPGGYPKAQYVERQFDSGAIHFIALAARRRPTPDSIDRFYHLTLQNGDKLSVVLDRDMLQLTDGWQERLVPANALIDVTFNGGIQGVYEDGFDQKDLGFAFVKNPQLGLRIPHCDDCMRLSWEQVAQLKLDLGDFAGAGANPLVREDLYPEPSTPSHDYVAYAPEPEYARQPEYTRPSPSYPADEAPVEYAVLSQPMRNERPQSPASERPDSREQMVLVPGGQFYVSVADDVASASHANLLPTANMPSFVIDIPSFLVDKHEVSNAEYLAFVKSTGHTPPAHWRGLQVPIGQETAPVVNVSYQDAAAYARWAGKRLPSEVEWQRASEEASTLVAMEAERKRQSLGDQAFSILSLIGGFETVLASDENATTSFSYLMDDIGSRVAEWTSSSAVADPRSPLSRIAGMYHTNVEKYGQHHVVRKGFVTDVDAPDYRSTLHQAQANEGTGFRCVKDLL